MSWFSSIFSGGSSSGGSGFDWTGAVLRGVSAYAASRSTASSNKQNTQQSGQEDRKTIAFEKSLEDYYDAKRRREKRDALDTYHSFSKLSSYAPAGYTLPAKPVVPTKPSP